VKNTSWKDIAELIGMIAIVLSLLFVGLQLKQSQQLAVEEGVSYSNDRQNAIRGLMVANAEIWHKACAGEPLDPASRIIAAKIYGAWIDHVSGEYILRSEGTRQSEESRQRIVEEFAAQYWIYPGLGELHGSRRDWHNGAVETFTGFGEFSALIRNRVEELVASGIKPEIDTAWCGRT
jgi:hypothetical protein